MKLKLFFKRTLCIFLSVMMLFFCVNNSYFSPHKMDNVEATAIVGTVAVSAELIIELIAAIGVTCLGAAVINDIIDWDWNAICQDVHDWCRDNIAVLDQYVTDGTSALKEWALADEWEVVEGGGGAPDPSPSPDSDNKFSHKVWGASDVWTIGNLIAGVGILSEEFLNKYVSQDEGVVEVVKAYVNDKITNFSNGNPLSLTDPISNSLQNIYGGADDNPHYYGSIISNTDGTYFANFSGRFEWDNGKYNDFTVTASSLTGRPFATIDSLDGSSFYFQQVNSSAPLGYSSFYGSMVRFYYRGYGEETRYTDTVNRISLTGQVNSLVNCDIPVFLSSDTAGIQAYVVNGDDSACINREREHNYIDSSDEYGWASTADLSPADLAAANPALANDLIGRDVSISSLVAAINALKKQLEDQNPNTDTGGSAANPVPYPDVPTYSVIVNSVVSDPDIFPDSAPGIDPDPGKDPDVDPDPGTDTGKDYTGFLGQIINLLKSILQAIKDFMSWFVIDFPAIKAHLLAALAGIPGFDGFDSFLAIVTDIKGQIIDSYEYPKITIQTPDILLQFVKAPEIVLLDFKDYAEYFIWVRTAMAFAILFGFAMWCVRDIKVELTLN